MSSGYYIYAILSRQTELPAVVGFDGGAVSSIHWRELTAAVSHLRLSEMPPTAENVLRHESIVESLRLAGPALPVRFGTILADETAVEQAMVGRYDALAADLARLGDKVELGLTVLWNTNDMGFDEAPPSDEPAGPVGSRGPGARYLLARMAEHRRAESVRSHAGSLARHLDDTLLCHALENRTLPAPTPGIALRTMYLLEPRMIAVFRKALDCVREQHPYLRFLLSGPWPPYSFVTPPEPGFEMS